MLQDIEAARVLLRDVIVPTPLLFSPQLSAELNARVSIKAESP